MQRLKNRISNVMKSVGLTLFLVSVTFVSIPGNNAHAYCDGKGRAAALADYWGIEQAQYTSTCDGDGYYAGKVRDPYTDGHYVQVRLSTRHDMSNEWIHVYTGSTRYFRIWGTWYMRVCLSGVPLGKRDDIGCTQSVYHYGS